LCQKLIKEQLYTVATIMTTPRSAVDTGEYTELSDMTGMRAFVAALAGHIAAEAARK
jgi:type II restriction enzyme